MAARKRRSGRKRTAKKKSLKKATSATVANKRSGTAGPELREEFLDFLGSFKNSEGISKDLHQAISVETGLEAAIAERVFYETFVVEGLADIYETQADLLDILDKNIAQP